MYGTRESKIIYLSQHVTCDVRVKGQSQHAVMYQQLRTAITNFLVHHYHYHFVVIVVVIVVVLVVVLIVVVVVVVIVVFV